MQKKIIFEDLDLTHVTSLTEYIEYWKECLRINNISNITINCALYNAERDIQEHTDVDTDGKRLSDLRELIEKQFEYIYVLI